MINYHGHTSRCKHALGNDEEYVLKAIEAGYDAIGFSDHIFYPNSIENIDRGEFDEMEDYIKSIRYLQEKYKDKIKIYLAYECEYNELFDEYFKKVSNECDYLIFGNHYADIEFVDKKHYRFIKSTYGTDYIDEYFEVAKKALSTGLFKIFAHPDLFMYSYPEWNEKLERKSYELCRLAKEKNVALEINCGAIRNNGKIKIGNEIRYRYPVSNFFKIAKEVGNKIIIGLDVHKPEDYLSNARNKALEFAKELNLKIIDKLDTID